MTSLPRLAELHFELTFSPTIELISIVRRFVSSSCEQVLEDREAASRLGLTTHELLENARKYATDGETTIRVDVGSDRSRIQIRLANRAGPDHLAELTRRFREMDACADPFIYYQMKMVETMRRRGGSGLGLARLRAEADMTLSLNVEGDRVCLLADTYALAAAAGEEARA